MSEQLDLERLREIVREAQRGDLRRWWEAVAALPTLLSRLAAVEAIHYQVVPEGVAGPGWCHACPPPWPCPTIAALHPDPSQASTDA